MKKIAIQGIKGCFHHVSLIKVLCGNDYEIVECKDFNQLTLAITNGDANLGVMAIENSIIGSLLFNYISLSNHHFQILRSIVLYIEQHLMAITGKYFNEILSHPIALQQCDNFISKKIYIRPIEYNDTALSSLYISNNMLKKKAAIASTWAAKEYRLDIISQNIQNISSNFTRFFIIDFFQRKIKEIWDKSSILFCLKQNFYNLFLNIFNIITDKKIFFYKILSIRDRYGEYLFYIDIIIDDNMGYEQMKLKIKYKSYIFSTLGEYINFNVL